jgi:hypothetical protein
LAGIDGFRLHIESHHADAEAKRLVEIQSDLAQEPQKVVARLQTQRTKLQNLQKALKRLCDASSEAAFTERDRLQKNLDQKADAARMASEALFVASPLPDIGIRVANALGGRAALRRPCGLSDEEIPGGSRW